MTYEKCHARRAVTQSKRLRDKILKLWPNIVEWKENICKIEPLNGIEYLNNSREISDPAVLSISQTFDNKYFT